MATVFGVVGGAVSIATAFTACVDCFNYVQLGRHFGRDHQTVLLVLDAERLRLTRWGAAVGIYHDPKLGKASATAEEVSNAKAIMFQLLSLFEDSAKVSEKYKLSARAGEDLAVLNQSDFNPLVLDLSNSMRLLARKRQKVISPLKVVTWALYHRAESKELSESIGRLLDKLEEAFPAHGSVTLAQQEVAGIRDPGTLELLTKATQDIDSILHAAAKDALTGHRYLNVSLDGKGQLGDAFSSDWTKGAVGAGHTYDNVKVNQGAQGLLENKYGGKDFWET